MKSYEETMEILEAFDLTECPYSAAGLVGCSPHTVESWVAKRDAGLLPVPGEVVERPKLIDPFLDKIEEWVEGSDGKVRADVAYEKLVVMGFTGSARTVRRAVARLKKLYVRGHRRIYRPWVVEPGMWAQWDWGQGPTIDGRDTNLWCAWLAWSRTRVVIPTWDRKMATVIACLDRTMREFGGVPTYWLTDNEKTVTVEHVAGVPVRHPMMVEVGRHYGCTVTTCVPFDPESKGGSESTVKLAKADLVPTDANLLDEYGSWSELVAACDAFMVEVNSRVHTVTRRRPIEMLADERTRLHRLPDVGFTAVFGQSRKVSWMSTISWGGVAYSVPHELADEQVWARVDGDEIVITHLAAKGATEVARHLLSTPGNPRIRDEHYPARPAGPTGREPKATNPAEEAFLGLGMGARQWLIEAGATGATRVRAKMAEAVQLAVLHGTDRVDWALGHAASFGRFGEGDIVSILAANPPGVVRTASDQHSLQNGTAAWEGFGQ